MQNKVLILASVASMIDQFNMNNIEILKRLGYEVHVACNFNEGNTCSVDRIKRLKEKLKFMNVSFFQIDFTRSVFNIRQDIIAYQQVKKIVMFNQYNQKSHKKTIISVIFALRSGHTVYPAPPGSRQLHQSPLPSLPVLLPAWSPRLLPAEKYPASVPPSVLW